MGGKEKGYCPSCGMMTTFTVKVIKRWWDKKGRQHVITEYTCGNCGKSVSSETRQIKGRNRDMNDGGI